MTPLALFAWMLAQPAVDPCAAAASERVMVCLPTRPPPHGVLLLRQGSRLAGRLRLGGSR